MVYGGDDTVVEVLVFGSPISFQITTKVKISDSKQCSVVFHVNVILESGVAMVTTGGPGLAVGGIREKEN